MKERLRGVEALSELPFLEVVVEEEEAFRLLSENRRGALIENICFFDDLVAHVASRGMSPEQYANLLERDYPGVGMSFTEEELEGVYAEARREEELTFKDVMKYLFRERFPEWIKEEEPEKNPAALCMGYITDLLTIIRPRVAGFEEGVGLVVECMRETGFSPFDLGVIVDDAERMKAMKKGCAELFVDGSDG